jgi:uncharacterized protein YkwD
MNLEKTFLYVTHGRGRLMPFLALLWIVGSMTLSFPVCAAAEGVIGEPESLTYQQDAAGGEETAQNEETPSLTKAQRTLVLSLVNRARRNGRTCGGTYYGPTRRVVWDFLLARAAQKHSKDMASHNFFSHVGSDGSTVGDRVSATGYDWQMCGENIAAGYRGIRTVVNAWLNSPGHCANIMEPGFKEMALGRASNSGSDYGIYWTQVFATPMQ